MQLDLVEGRSAAGDEESACPNSVWTLDELMAAIVERAPEALGRRVLLQAVEWRRISAAQVARMMQALDERKQAAPRWLLKAVLLAGHEVPEKMMATAPTAYRALNRLNGEQGDGGVDLEIFGANDGVEAEVRRAVIAKLAAEDGRRGDARRMALTLWPQTPEVLAPVRSVLAGYVEQLPAVHVTLTGYSTTSTLAGDLAHAFAGEGYRAIVAQSDFGQAAATLLAPNAQADAHVLLLDMDGLARVDWRCSHDEKIASGS